MTDSTRKNIGIAFTAMTTIAAIIGWAIAFGGGNATLRADVSKALEGVQRIEAKRKDEKVGDRLARIEEKLESIKQSLQRIESKR